jgi:hypothetical protein
MSVKGKSKKYALAGVHKKFECCQHTEMYLPALKAQDAGKMELSPYMVSFHSFLSSICLNFNHLINKIV